ncbi:MAG: hypothetical protein K6T78_15765 [Alicyclobacillus sp.]|nr:hypothetical protein [Alicyclobacillus sp.]
MSYATQKLLTDEMGRPIPQQWSPVSGNFEPIQGHGSSMSMARGAWYQVGSGATTTSLPLSTQGGLALWLSAAMQAKFVGGTAHVVVNSQLCEATITAVTASGTLTLDSALPAAPSAGTALMVTPPDQVSLTGSNAINAGVVTATSANTATQLPNVSCREVTVIGLKGNTGQIYVGGSNVSTSTYGAELDPKDSITIAVNNANLVWFVATVAGEGISYVAV